MITIKECSSSSEIMATFDVMQQLRPKIGNKENYRQLIQSLMQTEGYRLVAIFDDETCVTVAGFRVKRCLFSDCKPEMHIEDLVTDFAHRSQDFGKKMFAWLKTECTKLGYVAIILDSGMQRKSAHKFYEKEGMEAIGLHFSMPSSSSITSA